MSRKNNRQADAPSRTNPDPSPATTAPVMQVDAATGTPPDPAVTAPSVDAAAEAAQTSAAKDDAAPAVPATAQQPPQTEVAPAAPAAPPVEPTTSNNISLGREGTELSWTDESNGQRGFIVETSHDRTFWRVEARLPPGTTRYAPAPTPPSATDFYRVSHDEDGELRGRSNEVVVHFN